MFAPFFFPSSNGQTSLLLAMATVSLTFISRPIGGIFFGHFGDRIGRKSVWLYTLVGIGIASILIGFLPTFQQVGLIATVALIALRLCQGFFFAGEEAGGWVLTVESAPSKWRGFSGSIVGIGAGLGQVLLSISILLASTLAPGSEFSVWGWRIIFWFGAVPFILALIFRWKISESVEWKAKAASKVEKIPLVAAFKNNKKFFIITLIAFFGQTFFIYGSIIFLPSFLKLYTTNSPSAIATIVLVANVAVMFGSPIWGYLSDKMKSRRTFLTLAFLINASILYPLIFVFNLGIVGFSIFAAIALGFINPTTTGILPSWITENTRTSARYSAIASARSMGQAIGGLAPYTVVLLSATLGPVFGTALISIIGCLSAVIAIPFSPADRVGKTLE